MYCNNSYFYYDNEGKPKTSNDYSDQYRFTLYKSLEGSYNIVDYKQRWVVIKDSNDFDIVIKEHEDSNKNGFSIRSSKNGLYLGISDDKKVILFDDDSTWETRFYLFYDGKTKIEKILPSKKKAIKESLIKIKDGKKVIKKTVMKKIKDYKPKEKSADFYYQWFNEKTFLWYSNYIIIKG
jgi:activator of 2-hydroxyglutaryl-CoA dehydratase